MFPLANLAMSTGVTADEMQERLTAAIGPEALAAAWEVGSAMSDREVRDYALAAIVAVRDSAADPADE